jgi:FixJ family two-component response regulator
MSTPNSNQPGRELAANSRAKVYLIDDDQSILRALSRRLALAGYDTETFSSPADFLKRQTHNGLACIVLDLMMPEMSGLDFQAALRARSLSLPVIFLSGHGDVPAASAAFKGGAVDFLTKPVHSEQLLGAVSAALAKQAAAFAVQNKTQSIRSRYQQLTPREREVCELVVQGQLNKQISFILSITEATVKKHRGRMMEKLGFQSLAELVSALEMMRRDDALTRG